ncbi:hypothetical protein KQI42_00745 [Tissierella sp. MSJ-40]|uniref:Uncharacterized protein n=1 Tax=Tissierella simiarum TaxID=2841534 RepID=A0ABS6E0Z2_9FIRM|nr:hypothetical protein [Tissierella simiarum]MBU5436511.1 hypothetical protein [Tissierella simiarum]
MSNKRVIYILLTHSGSILSKCIKTYTREPYSHVSIALDHTLNELYSFGRIKPNNPLIGGFVKEDIIRGTYSRFPNTTCALYSLEISNLQYNKLRKEIHKFKSEKEKYGYNLIGLIGVMLDVPMEKEYNYFCSQFVATLLYNSGVYLFRKSAGLVSPKDFRQCRNLELMYEGKLMDYWKEEKLYYSSIV